MFEMTLICGNWLKYVGKGQIFEKRHKNVENNLETWEISKIFGKWLRYMMHGLSILETA